MKCNIIGVIEENPRASAVKERHCAYKIVSEVFS